MAVVNDLGKIQKLSVDKKIILFIILGLVFLLGLYFSLGINFLSSVQDSTIYKNLTQQDQIQPPAPETVYKLSVDQQTVKVGQSVTINVDLIGAPV